MSVYAYYTCMHMYTIYMYKTALCCEL